VLPSVAYFGRQRAASHHDAIPLREFLDALPAVRVAKEVQATSAATTSARAKLIADNPWVLPYLEEGRDILKKNKSSLGGPAAEEEEEEEEAAEADEDPITEAQVESIFTAMEEARKESSSQATTCFRVVPLGGQWQAKHLGVAQNAWQAKCIGTETQDFCRSFAMQDSCRFDTSLYGHTGALQMARIWVLKLQYFFDTWTALGCPTPCPWPDDLLARFQEPAYFAAMEASDLPNRAKARLQWLRDLKPAGA